jgi:chlorite dismutase
VDAGHGDETHAHDHDDEARAHAETDADGHSNREHGDAESQGSAHPGSSAEGDHPHDSGVEETEREDVQSLLASLGFHAGDDYDAGDYGLVLYSDAETQELASELDGLRSNFEHYDSHVTSAVRAHGGRAVVVSIWDNEGAADTAHGFLTDLPGITETVRGPLDGSGETATEAADDEDGSENIREELADLDIYAGQPHGEDIYALVLYSEADRDELVAEVEDLSEGFDRYDTHSGTKVYEDPDSERNAVVSLWETEDAADTASDYLSDLPGVVGWAGEGDGFGTMGMFYTVKPEHREDFVEKFGTVGGLLEDMDGHRETALLANVDDENDMFIASQWDSKEDAMGFFRSEAFSDTVDWGRDILADKPRHVFLA